MADSNHNDTIASKPRRAGRGAPRSPQMTVHVTREIIDTAIRKDSKNCMIAETIKEMLPYSTHVIVDAATIRWTNPDKGLRYGFETPLKVREAILDFDEGRHIEPFSFLLRSAWVTYVRRRDGAKKHITQDGWEKLREQIKEIHSEQGLKWGAIAREMNVAEGTLTARISDNDVPITKTVNKMEKWVLKHTGEKPAPRTTSQADKVSGPMRIRSITSLKRGRPEVIGGKLSPVTTHLRQFGLRMYRIPKDERE